MASLAAADKATRAATRLAKEGQLLDAAALLLERGGSATRVEEWLGRLDRDPYARPRGNVLRRTTRRETAAPGNPGSAAGAGTRASA